MRKTVNIEKQVAVVLVDEGRMRKTANAFGIAICTVFKIFIGLRKLLTYILDQSL